MIQAWLQNPAPLSGAVSAVLPEQHRARYADRINSLPPSTLLSVTDGEGEVELITRRRYFEVILIKNRVFDVVLLDMVSE